MDEDERLSSGPELQARLSDSAIEIALLQSPQGDGVAKESEVQDVIGQEAGEKIKSSMRQPTE